MGGPWKEGGLPETRDGQVKTDWRATQNLERRCRETGRKLKKITCGGVNFLQVRSEAICWEEGKTETEQRAHCRWRRLERLTHRLTNETKAFAGTTGIRNKLSGATATRLPEFPWQFCGSGEERGRFVCWYWSNRMEGQESPACQWKNYSNETKSLSGQRKRGQRLNNGNNNNNRPIDRQLLKLLIYNVGTTGFRGGKNEEDIGIKYDKDVKCRFSSNCKKVCFNSKNQQLVQQKQTKEVYKRTYDSHRVKKETTHPVGSHLRSTPHQQTKHNM